MKRYTQRIPARRSQPRRGPAGIPAEEWRSDLYVSFLHQEGYCVVCKARYPDGAHTQNNGMRSRGPDSSRAPLCRWHHQEYDADRRQFEERYEKDMKREAAVWWLAFTIWRESR